MIVVMTCMGLSLEGRDYPCGAKPVPNLVVLPCMHGRKQGDFGPRCRAQQFFFDRAFARSGRPRGVGDSRGRFELGGGPIQGGRPSSGPCVSAGVRRRCRPQCPHRAGRPCHQHAAGLHARGRGQGGHRGRGQRDHSELRLAGDASIGRPGAGGWGVGLERARLGSGHRPHERHASHRRDPGGRRAHARFSILLWRVGGAGFRRQPLALQAELEPT